MGESRSPVFSPGSMDRDSGNASFEAVSKRSAQRPFKVAPCPGVSRCLCACVLACERDGLSFLVCLLVPLAHVYSPTAATIWPSERP